MKKVKTGAYIPLPVAPIVVVGANVDGKPNYMAVGFVSGVNIKPAIVCISLNKQHHTPKGILENGTFSINVPSTEHVIETDYCGLVSGRIIDKSTIFTTFYGELETAPMIEEFPITCECRFTGQKVEFEMDTVYFGEVVQVHVNEKLRDENGKVNIQKVDPMVFSGLENRYRSLGQDLGEGWQIGKQYQPKQELAQSEVKHQCQIVERPVQPALSIRKRVMPFAISAVIGECAMTILQYAREGGRLPAGALFVAYHGFNGQQMDIEVGFPFGSGMEGSNNIQATEIPGGKVAFYRHVGPYQKLSEVRAALEQWLHANGYAINGAAYDFYLNDPQTTPPERLETEILFPLG